MRVLLPGAAEALRTLVRLLGAAEALQTLVLLPGAAAQLRTLALLAEATRAYCPVPVQPDRSFLRPSFPQAIS